MSFAAHLPFPSPASSLSQPSQVPSSSPPTPTSNRGGCCENGRPVLTDPATGQSVCSCQYSSALLGYSRLPGLSGGLFPPAGYPSGAPPPSAAGYGVALGSEGSAFYSPLTAGGNSLRDSTDAWRSLTQSSLYDSAPMGFYPYGGYGGLDLNARRKNATRESTNTLKAWLHEHIKNPYPTKGEKIMLAIITKMTLTQVSTWFANARRRLKKENKMTWSPRNRSEDGDEDDDDDDAGDDKNGDDGDKEKRLGNDSDREIDVDGSSKYARSKPHHHHHNNNNNESGDNNSVSPAPSIGEDSRSRLSPPQSRDSDPGGFHHLHHSSGNHTTTAAGGDSSLDIISGEQLNKPKIWSVTDFLGASKSGGGGGGGGGNEPSSCKETGMKMDVMRCVPTSAESAHNNHHNHHGSASSAVDLTGRTVVGHGVGGGALSGVSAASASAAAAAHAHAAALSSARAAAAAGGPGGFLSPMTSLSPAQQLSSYQNALASYAAHSSPYSPYALASAAEMNKLVMKPTATRFSPYGVSPKQPSLESPFPPARDFSVLREGE